MALDPRHPIADDAASVDDQEQPRMLLRPAEPPSALGRVADAEPMRAFRRELQAQLQQRGALRLGSLRATMRAWAGRVSGRSDRRLLFALADATNGLANHCDNIVDRLGSQEALTSDVAHAFGEELTHLRAEVIHLRTLAASLEQHRSG